MLRAQGAYNGAYLILQTKYLRARTSELEQIRVSAEQARAADHISDKPLVVLEGSGHDIPSDRPTAIVDAVREIRAAVTNLN